jgi:16S rRNA (cytosine1402-N4)-methyltransferase
VNNDKDIQTEKEAGDTVHISVLLNEVVEGLAISEGDIFVDMTVNGGGHSSVIGKLVGKTGTVIGIDADPTAVTRAGARLKDCPAKVHLVTDNFRNIKKVMTDLSIGKADKILFDLGLSTHELESSGRGFSFQKNEPLLMTFPTDSKKVSFTAKDIVNTWDEENIVSILSGYGEERFARRIAKRIVDTRKMQEIETTQDLVGIIASAVPGWYRNGRKSHFATKTFQALRMTVNDEIRALQEALLAAFEVIDKGGRIAVISFHSMEDRLVKKFFRERSREGEAELITKKPIVPSSAEMSANRRSRSAKLRIIKKK